jgi:hypothetical protein
MTGCGADDEEAEPVTALGPTHRRVLAAASRLQASGRNEWTLAQVVDEVAASGPAVGWRRLHDVVTELRGMEPPLVAPVRRGYLMLTSAGTELTPRQTAADGR